MAFSGLGLQANGQSGSFLPNTTASATNVGNFGMSGYGLAQKGYGANLDAYSRLAQSDAQLRSSETMADAQGFGSMVGAAGGITAAVII